MPIIKNIGKRDRMVADRILKPGDSKSITAKQAELFAGDTDFEITDFPPSLPAFPKEEEERPVFEAKKTVVKKNRGRKK